MSPDFFDHPEATMSYVAAGRVLAHCVSATGCDHFGLLVGCNCSVAGLGLVGALAGTALSVQQALQTIVRYLPLFDRGSALSVRLDGDDALFIYGIHVHDLPAADQAYDLSLMIMFNTIKDLCGSCWRPTQVTLPHKAPRDVSPFRKLFGAEVHFDAPEASVAFDRFWLGRPLANSLAAERLRLLDRAEQLAAMLDMTVTEQVRRRLRASLPAHWMNEPEMAANLLTNPRTLRRWLTAEGTTFRTILNDIRCNTAQHFLSVSTLDCGEITLLLGYAENSAFSRAFRSWTGLSPEAWRKRTTSAGLGGAAAARSRAPDG